MNCCQCQGYESFFNPKTAARELKQYRRNGPAKNTRLLIDTLRAEGITGMTLLDIGGGVGAIQHELLKAGARAATSVEASTAYMEAAKEEAKRQGLAGRASCLHGDFVDLADQVPAADIVTLDRVICCYHDMPALVGLSAARATRLYGVVYPRDTWWMRLFAPLNNFMLRILRRPIAFFLHPTEAVDEVVRAAGLKPRFHHEGGIWQVAVYARPTR